MKRSLIIAVFLALSMRAVAQQNYQDVIYLKNSIIVRGTIIEQTLNKSVRIVSTDGDSLKYNMDEIARLTGELIPDKSEQSHVRTWLSPDYQLIVEGSIAYKVDKFGTNFYKLSIINGIRLNRNFYFGFGIGLRYNPNPQLHGGITPDYEHIMIPVFVNFRNYFAIWNKVSAYISADLGYTFSESQNTFFYGKEYYYLNGSGVLLKPAAGIVFKITDRSALNIGVGYEMQKGEFTVGGYAGKYLQYEFVNKLVGSIGVNAGIIF